MLADRAAQAAAGTEASSIALNYIGDNWSVSNLSSYDFGDFTFAGANLAVVAIAGGRDGVNRTISGCTIGGVSAALIATSADHPAAGIAYLELGSGGAKNVSVTFSGGVAQRCQVFVYEISGYSSATPHDSDTSQNEHDFFSAPYEYQLNCDVPDGGVAVLALYSEVSVTIACENASIDLQEFHEAQMAGAYIVGASGMSSANAEQIEHSGTPGESAGAMASWS